MTQIKPLTISVKLEATSGHSMESFGQVSMHNTNNKGKMGSSCLNSLLPGKYPSICPLIMTENINDLIDIVINLMK